MQSCRDEYQPYILYSLSTYRIFTISGRIGESLCFINLCIARIKSIDFTEIRSPDPGTLSRAAPHVHCNVPTGFILIWGCSGRVFRKVSNNKLHNGFRGRRADLSLEFGMVFCVKSVHFLFEFG